MLVRRGVWTCQLRWRLALSSFGTGRTPIRRRLADRKMYPWNGWAIRSGLRWFCSWHRRCWSRDHPYGHCTTGCYQDLRSVWLVLEWRSCGRRCTGLCGSFSLWWGRRRPMFCRYQAEISRRWFCVLWCLGGMTCGVCSRWRHLTKSGVQSLIFLWLGGPYCPSFLRRQGWIHGYRTWSHPGSHGSSTVAYHTVLCCWYNEPSCSHCRVYGCGRGRQGAVIRNGLRRGWPPWLWGNPTREGWTTSILWGLRCSCRPCYWDHASTPGRWVGPGWCAGEYWVRNSRWCWLSWSASRVSLVVFRTLSWRWRHLCGKP